MSRRRQEIVSEEQPATLSLEAIDEGVAAIDFQITADQLEFEDGFYSFPTAFRATLTVTRALQTFSVGGRVEGAIRGECCRCLTPVEEPLRADVKLLVQRRQASEDELEAVAEDDLIRIVDPGTREINLVDRLRDSLALELPMRVHCRDDCKGLCPQCGVNLNEGECDCGEATADPRWDALARLRDTLTTTGK